MYSVEDRQARHHAPIGIYQSRIISEPLGSLFDRVQGRQLVGIWLHHPIGGSSTPYMTELVLDTVEATVSERSLKCFFIFEKYEPNK